MANILNKKEDVLKIELTKHGKKLLASGLFDPKYFYFFDNSIIYDSSYAKINNEDTNFIQDRILNKSLTFSSLNTTSDILKNKLGSSDIINDYAPSWDLRALNGTMIPVDISSSYGERVFNVGDIIYTTSIEEETSEVIVEDDYLLIDLKELNLTDDITNFEIELIAYDSISGGKEIGLQRKLYFYEKKSNIIDDIIYDEDELPSKFFDINPNETDVQYYFDLLVDDEIDTELIISKEKTVSQRIAGTYTNYPSGYPSEDKYGTVVTPEITKKC